MITVSGVIYTNKSSDINLIKKDEDTPVYWYDLNEERFYLYDKPSDSWILTDECPLDPHRKKTSQLDRIESKLDRLSKLVSIPE